MTKGEASPSPVQRREMSTTVNGRKLRSRPSWGLSEPAGETLEHIGTIGPRGQMLRVNVLKGLREAAIVKWVHIVVTTPQVINSHLLGPQQPSGGLWRRVRETLEPPGRYDQELRA